MHNDEYRIIPNNYYAITPPPPPRATRNDLQFMGGAMAQGALESGAGMADLFGLRTAGANMAGVDYNQLAATRNALASQYGVANLGGTLDAAYKYLTDSELSRSVNSFFEGSLGAGDRSALAFRPDALDGEKFGYQLTGSLLAGGLAAGGRYAGKHALQSGVDGVANLLESLIGKKVTRDAGFNNVDRVSGYTAPDRFDEYFPPRKIGDARPQAHTDVVRKRNMRNFPDSPDLRVHMPDAPSGRATSWGSSTDTMQYPRTPSEVHVNWPTSPGKVMPSSPGSMNIELDRMKATPKPRTPRKDPAKQFADFKTGAQIKRTADTKTLMAQLNESDREAIAKLLGRRKVSPTGNADIPMGVRVNAPANLLDASAMKAKARKLGISVQELRDRTTAIYSK